MKVRKKPVVVEAMEFTDETKDQVYNFIRCTTSTDWEDGEPVLKIQTLEGVMTARLGDYIIKGVNGEFYPCKPDIFKKTYDIVERETEKNKEWYSLVTSPPKKDRVGDIFEIDSEHFKEPILAKLGCEANGRDLYFVDMYGSSFTGYINYREVTE